MPIASTVCSLTASRFRSRPAAFSRVPWMYGVSLPSDPSCVSNVSVPSTLKIGAMMTIWLSSRFLRAPIARSRATIISASAASGSGGWMLPNRNITGLPDARACCADVTRGFDSTIAGAALRIGLTNMLTTWMFSLLPLSALMNSRSWIDETVRVKPLRSATVWTSADHCPCQPAGTSSPQ